LYQPGCSLKIAQASRGFEGGFGAEAQPPARIATRPISASVPAGGPSPDGEIRTDPVVAIAVGPASRRSNSEVRRTKEENLAEIPLTLIESKG
jgi:hypothetical protein